jgi:hypothetical protein
MIQIDFNTAVMPTPLQPGERQFSPLPDHHHTFRGDPRRGDRSAVEFGKQDGDSTSINFCHGTTLFIWARNRSLRVTFFLF